MKLHFKNILFINLLAVFIFITHSLAEGDYPKTKEEREMDEMGSVLGGEGITFRPSKSKNESTRTQIGFAVNKYLWQAALNVLSFSPLNSVDSNGGVIITDWYSPKDNPQFSFKIHVFIKANVISPDAIEVRVFERVLKNNNWQQTDSKSNLSYTLEDKILRKARELYIQSERSE
jgi:hypothetical protein